MAVDRSPQFGALYHGTDHPFTPGETVKPGSYPAAFATSSTNRAAAYADSKSAEQGHLFGMVYNVHPIGEVKKSDFHTNVYESEQGFKAGSLHSFGGYDYGRGPNE